MCTARAKKRATKKQKAEAAWMMAAASNVAGPGGAGALRRDRGAARAGSQIAARR